MTRHPHDVGIPSLARAKFWPRRVPHRHRSPVASHVWVDPKGRDVANSSADELRILIPRWQVAGGRGYYLTHEGVLLNQALINCALHFAYKRGFMPVHTPFFMRQVGPEGAG